MSLCGSDQVLVFREAAVVRIIVLYRGLQRNFTRAASETFAVLLRRMRINLERTWAKGQQPPFKALQFRGPTGPYEDDDTLDRLLQPGSELAIDEVCLPLVVEPLFVLEVRLSGSMCQATVPIMPDVRVLNGTRYDLQFLWTDHEGRETTGPYFVPQPEHVGTCIDVHVCDPESPSRWWVDKTPPVDAWNAAPWVDRRLVDFGICADSEFRIASFNILAPPYARTPYALSMCFPHCHKKFMEAKHRRCRVLRQILLLNADIQCLQECTFNQARSLEFSMRATHRMLLSPKRGRIVEGPVMLLRRSRFNVVQERTVVFKHALVGSKRLAPLVSHFSAQWPDFAAKVLPNMNTVCQIVLVKDNVTDRHIVVCNTHLFFDGKARHIKLLQVLTFVDAAKDFQASSGVDATIVFLGDLNSSETTACYQLLMSGETSRDHPHWQDGLTYTWGVQEDAVEAETAEPDEDRTQSSDVRTADEIQAIVNEELVWHRDIPEEALSGVVPLGTSFTQAYEDYPPFTNIVTTFQATLDHILLETGGPLKVTKTLPHITEGDLECGALPDSSWPSDHIDLAADLTWLYVN